MIPLRKAIAPAVGVVSALRSSAGANKHGVCGIPTPDRIRIGAVAVYPKHALSGDSVAIGDEPGSASTHNETARLA